MKSNVTIMIPISLGNVHLAKVDDWTLSNLGRTNQLDTILGTNANLQHVTYFVRVQLGANDSSNYCER